MAPTVRPPLPLRRVLFVLIFHCLLDVAVGGLKCKCTQNSPKVACEHGMCEVSSAASACLMLDHPHSGRHYACSTSELREGECVEKRSRSGANVKVCSCNSSDFCNFKIWPDGKEDQAFGAEESDDETEESAEDENSEEVTGEGSLKNGATAANPPTGVPVAISIGLLAFILRVICDRSDIFG
uniref:Activin types I and II receptor domain-containing protein n=1 Tax=Globodera rostochiensis TaxID=31243 RepID=A0A914HCU1_GLORO